MSNKLWTSVLHVELTKEYSQDVEALGLVLGYSTENENFHNISLGQGQETLAELAIETSYKEGHWVLLQV